MNEPLRVLQVEDSESDAALIVRLLEKAGYVIHSLRVEDGDEMRAALAGQTWDVIICDYRLPQFDAPAALKVAQETGQDLPFIVVSAAMGEELAVAMMKSGAHDYLMKDKLARLAPAVARELRDARVRQDCRRAEERLRNTQKLESIGLLAGGIAHDFNNILTAVGGNIDLVLEDLAPDSPAASTLRIAIEAVERAAGLTRQLLAYAGKGAFVRRHVSVAEIAANTMQMLRASVPEHVEVRTELAPDLPVILMDPSQMEQLFLNLILNGVEAIGEKPGVVVVRTSRCGASVRIEVSDTGCGMDEQTRKRMFDPFFTTKFTGRGLGLAAVDGIVRSLNGEISVESAVGRGTRISVVLPVTGVQDAKPEAAVCGRDGRLAGGAVLIVDDEPQIRKVAAAFLKKQGISVVEAAGGKEAIDYLAASGSEIRAVLLDMAMPGMKGNEALAAIQRLRPDIHVIVSSGFSETEVKRHFAAMSVRSFLPKPYTGEQLLAHVLPAMGMPR